MKGRLACTGGHSSCGAGLKGSPSLYLLKILSRLHLNKNPAARRFYRPADGTRAPLALHLGLSVSVLRVWRSVIMSNG